MENEFLKLKINSKGAELSSIFIKSKNKEVLWQADPLIWPRHAPVLFPIVGKLVEDKYTLDGVEFKLGQHGFARDCEHIKVSEGEFRLASNFETKSKFPFDFILTTKYLLDKNKIHISYTIENKSDKNMPFSLGAHPGFNVTNSKKVRVEFENQEAGFYSLKNGLVDFTKFKKIEKNILLEAESFIDDALIFRNLNSKWIKLFDSLALDEHVLTMHFAELPYFGIWSKVDSSGSLPFVCLEPWWGVADSVKSQNNFREKEGINILPAKQARNFSYTLEIKI